MGVSVELQVISRLLSTESEHDIETLLSFGEEYYARFDKEVVFIKNHYEKYGTTPDRFTFFARFPEVENIAVDVNEPIEYLVTELRKNRQQILVHELDEKLRNWDSDDISDAWRYIGHCYDIASNLEETEPMNIISQAEERSNIVKEYSQQERIPTGFDEIDKLMYGGLSTVEELLVIIARTNSGKSWICTKMMETAQRNGFPVLYYSPEMQSPLLATRFDTWRAHFKNSDIFSGKYTEEYEQYIDLLKDERTPAFIVEDKDMPDGVSVRSLLPIVKRFGIKLLIIDGLSYMKDDEKYTRDYDKYKHICAALFNLSKQCGCAVVVTMQANRATQESKDNQGDPFPSIYNAEGSDHPARIATQVFAVRQTFETHTLDIRLEKSRSAENTKPVLSYSWEVNTGHVQYIEDPESRFAEAPQIEETSTIQISRDGHSNIPDPDDILSGLDDGEDVSF